MTSTSPRTTRDSTISASTCTDFDATVARLGQRGLQVTMSGGWNSNGSQGRFAYLDAERHGGVTIELLWNKPRQ